MKLPHFLLAATAAATLASCKPHEEAVSHTQGITAAQVADTMTLTEEDVGHSPATDRIQFLRDNPDIHALYKRLDEGPNTTTYFNILCATYEKSGMEEDLANRMADVVSHLWTLGDLIRTEDITPDELRTALEYTLVFSGIHEAQTPPIYTVLE
jgi:hypothetical protein